MDKYTVRDTSGSIDVTASAAAYYVPVMWKLDK
jgi:hypothetical protein